MWLFEGDGDVLQGKRLWLRPGKTYLFGRTISEPGQTAISDKTISRKHLIIHIDSVPEGDGQNLIARSKLTIEDLKTKIGTFVNDTQIRGQKYVVTQPHNKIKMGHCSKLFRITWQPVVFSFSFTSKELRADPLMKLRANLEQLDIKFSTEYDVRHTTHVVSKKRNTSKGLQALVNARYIVTDEFINAVVDAAKSTESDSSPLERNYDEHWPNALEFLPPRGEEPVERDASLFAPDEARDNVFEGYTFIFYEKKQFDALLAPITNGKGKAVLKEAVPHETQIDDFITYVKGVAGEQGLGSFGDGSKGRVAVVVKFVPAKGADLEWYKEFTTGVSLRLDHRLVDQRDFLDAIVMNDASVLRRPLEVEPEPEPEPDGSQPTRRRREARTQPAVAMDVGESPDVSGSAPGTESAPPAPQPQQAAPPARRPRARRGAASRFKGFDEDNDVVADTAPAPEEYQATFVSQNSHPDSAPEPPAPAIRTRRGQRKRPASPSPPPAPGPARPVVQEDEGQVMDDIAPTAAAVKRRRVARGEDPVPRQKSPTPAPAADKQPGQEEPKIKKELDILDQASKLREAAEARAAAERADLAKLPEGVNLAEIRNLTIVEEMPVRRPVQQAEEDGHEDPRWDPRWNGRRNFKAFRKQGAADSGRGRARPKTIVALEEVKKKGFGIGDDYWLEDDGASNKCINKNKPAPAKESRTSSNNNTRDNTRTQQRRRPAVQTVAESSDEEMEDSVNNNSKPEEEEKEEEEEEVDETPLPRAKIAKRAEKAHTARVRESQRVLNQSQAQQRGKRTAPEPPPPPAKRQRPAMRLIQPDSDDSEDDALKFKFGRGRRK